MQNLKPLYIEWLGSEATCNKQVPSFDVITSLCEYSFVSEAWKVFVYVNGGASAIGNA